VGEATLAHDQTTVAHGAAAVAFARPHELTIITDPNHDDGIAASVVRILSFGASSRVELDSLAPSPDSELPIHYEVILPREQIQALKLVEGQRVRLVPSRIRVFQSQAA
jgi:sulfate transport system ATP-binding protein